MKTRIEKDVKSLKKVNNNNYKVSSADGTFFIINEQIIIDFKLRVGIDITNIYEKMLYENNFYRHLEKSFKYCLRGLKSSSHIRKYLVKNKCPDEFINRIILKLKESNMINDKEFIVAYTNNLVNRGYGKIYIKNKLKEMNLFIEDIIFSINNIDNNAYLKSLEKIAIKKIMVYKKTNNLSVHKLKKYLYSKGFESELINNVIRKLL